MTTTLEIVGYTLIVAAVSFFSWRIGLGVAGVLAVVMAYGLERRK